MNSDMTPTTNNNSTPSSIGNLFQVGLVSQRVHAEVNLLLTSGQAMGIDLDVVRELEL